MSRKRTSLIDIAEELQVAIFLKLDVKSILSCKCVCKHFNYITEDPNFVISHLKNQSHHSHSHVLIHYGCGIYSDPFYQIYHYLLSFDYKTKDITSFLPLTPPIPIIDGRFRSYVVGSCNGLICLAVWFDNYLGIYSEIPNRRANTSNFLLLLWNPVIRQCRYLPKHQSSCRPDVLEFGYLPESNDYVVVKIGGSPGFHLEVYKMSTDSWKTIEFNWLAMADFIPFVYRDRGPVFVNGSFHWVVKNSTFNCIVYFNLKDEELGLIKVVDNDSAIFDVVVDISIRGEMHWVLSVVDEKLAMIYWNSESYGFEIWVMNEYGIMNSWTCRFQIVETDYMYPISYWTNGMVLLDWFNYIDEYGYFFYDIESRSFRRIPFPLEYCFDRINGLTTFVETLVPVRKVELKEKGCHVPADIGSNDEDQNSA